MRYIELFRIEIDHQFYASGGDGGLSLVPDKPTMQFIIGQHILAKRTANGVRILIQADENGNPKTSFQPEQSMIFEIFPQSELFSHITALPTLHTGEILHFSNAGILDTQSELQSSVALSTGFHQGFRMVAKVEILLAEALATRGAGLPYKVVFPARSEKWKYYFVTDQETTDLAVEATDQSVEFSGQLIDGNSSDKVGIALRENFPEANLFLFASATPIPLSDRAKKNIQLLRDGHIMIRHLPNPEQGSEMIKIIRISK